MDKKQASVLRVIFLVVAFSSDIGANSLTAGGICRSICTFHIIAGLVTSYCHFFVFKGLIYAATLVGVAPVERSKFLAETENVIFVTKFAHVVFPRSSISIDSLRVQDLKEQENASQNSKTGHRLAESHLDSDCFVCSLQTKNGNSVKLRWHLMDAMTFPSKGPGIKE
jgi:hypothetical protein